MKIAIIGITGRLGKRIGIELRARGHQVIGMNRRAERVPVRLQGVDIPTVVADTADYDSILAGIQGADVVVLATAPTREHPEEYPEHSKNVIAACKTAGVARLIALSNYMALNAPDGRPMIEAEPPHAMFYDIESVFAMEANVFRSETELNWLLVAPPAELYPYGEVTGRYRIGENTLIVTDPANHVFLETSKISMEDLTGFIADEIENQRYRHTIVTLAY